MARPKQCFISYAHHDHEHFEKLLVGIKAVANIYGFEVWFDRRIHAGHYWNAKIQTEIENSQIFVCLTTNAFFASSYIFNDELPAIKHQHEVNQALVLPIIFEECIWVQFFGNYIELAPKTAKHNLLPVDKWKNQAEALGLATKAFAAAIEDWFGIKPATHFKSPVAPSAVAP
jgi:hypothetical protein